MECDEGLGSITSISLLSKKVTDDFNVEFKIASGVEFVGWKAYLKSSDGLLNELSSDYIKFTSYNTESNDGIYRATVKFLKGADGIVIKPYCHLLPKVTQILPEFTASGVDQDSIIKIHFNKTVNPESFGDFSCVSVYSSEGSLKEEYFETPYFSSDNKVLFIQPKEGIHIIAPDSGKKVDISVAVDFSDIKDADGLSLAQTEAHSYRIKESYGSQEKVKFLVKTVEGTGSFLSDGEKECTVGYTVDLQFTADKTNYKFVSLQAVSSADQSSRGEAVSFKLLESNEETGVYKVQVRIMENLGDILIQPLCLAYPAVTSYTPDKKDQENFANTPIEINFNMPMESAEAPFNFANVSLTVNGTSLASYFEKAFNSEKTVLTITPKTDELINYITSKNVAFIEVKVALSESISVTNGEHILPLIQNKESTFTVKYKGEKDDTKPQKLEFFVTKKAMTLETASSIADDDKFLLETFVSNGTTNYDKAMKNYCPGTFYIFGKYYCNGRQIKSITVDGTEYTSNNAEFSTDESGNILFCIKHTGPYYFKDENIDFFVTDAIGNKSDTLSFTAYITTPRFTAGILMFNLWPEDFSNFTKEKYETERKKLKISYDPKLSDKNRFLWNSTDADFFYDEGEKEYREGYDEAFYKEYFDTFKFECEYKDDSGTLRHGTFTNDKEKMVFLYELENVEKLNSLKLKLSVTDRHQNQGETEITFPDKNIITSLGENTSGKTEIKFQSTSETPGCSQFLIQKEGEVLKAVDIGYNFILKSGFLYKVIPCKYTQGSYNDQSYNFDYYILAGDLGEETYTSTSTLSSIGNVELDGEPSFSRSSESGYSNYMDITIKIKPDSWTKFDKIYVNNETYSFNKNEYSLVLYHNAYIPTMYTKATTFTVYGIKDKVRTSGTVCTIPQLTASDEYDYKGPEIKIERKNYDYFTVTMTDEDSGPDYANVLNLKKLDGTYKYVLNADNSFTIDVPIWEVAEQSDTSFEDYYHNVKFTVKGYDKKENVKTKEVQIRTEPVSRTYYELNKYSSSVWRLDVFGTVAKLGYYTWQSSKWTDTLTKAIDRGDQVIDPLPSNTFIKVTLLEDYGPSSNVPSDYYYTGTWNSGDYDLITPNGSSKDSVGISSDAPVFVQTLVTSLPYSDCSQWTPAKWELNRRHLGEKMLTFSSSDKITKRYKIPLTEINSGECYCVIAHFANGTSTISQVWQK